MYSSSSRCRSDFTGYHTSYFILNLKYSNSARYSASVISGVLSK